jgi:ABC-type dipeptide/oligopeptide/nickel transport system permease component
MLKFIVQRAIYSLILLGIASIFVFYGLRVTPGSVVDKLTTDYNRSTLGPVLTARFNLDKPISVQYVLFMTSILRGDPGTSLVTGKPIVDMIRESGVQTLILAAAGTLLTYAIAIPLGVLAAARRNSIFDQGSMLLSVLGMGVPNFFLALILIQIFAVQLHWLPAAGNQTFNNLILPAVVLSAEAIALNVRLMRSSLLEELNREYIRTLRAKGVRERRILWVHAFRNALPPVIALAGVLLRTLIGYTLIVEVIFRWPGLGSKLVNAVITRDYPVAQVLALLLTAAVLFFNFLADIGQQWADPRVREGVHA